MLLLQYGMVGDKALQALRPVLGGKLHTTVAPEFIEQQQVVGSARPQEEGDLCPTLRQLSSLPEQRGHADAASHEQQALAGSGGTEAMAQGQQTVDRVARLQKGQAAGAVADSGHQQPQLVALAVDEVDGDGTAQEGVRRAVDAHLDELPRLHGWQRLVVGQAQQHIALMQPLGRQDLQIE